MFMVFLLTHGLREDDCGWCGLRRREVCATAPTLCIRICPRTLRHAKAGALDETPACRCPAAWACMDPPGH
jgi:hypothetical protein